jgi:hypothetical protein
LPLPFPLLPPFPPLPLFPTLQTPRNHEAIERNPVSSQMPSHTPTVVDERGASTPCEQKQAV